MPNPAPLLSQFSSEIAALVAAAAPATVAIATRERASSGFFWRPNVVVAASDAIDADHGSEIEVISQAGRARMKLAGRDPATDVAILTSEAVSGAPLALAASAVVAAGEAVVVTGRSAHGVGCAVGFVSLVGEAWESMRGGKIDQRIGLDLRLRRELEGGPVLNAVGLVIGMAVAGPRRRTVVIPAATIERIAVTLLEHGRIKYGYLGVAGQPIRPQAAAGSTGSEARTGLVVLGLDTGGPAHQAGILQGDIITSVAGKPVGSPRQLRRSLGPDTVGRAVPCEIVRAGARMTVNVTIGERQSR